MRIVLTFSVALLVLAGCSETSETPAAATGSGGATSASGGGGGVAAGGNSGNGGAGAGGSAGVGGKGQGVGGSGQGGGGDGGDSSGQGGAFSGTGWVEISNGDADQVERMPAEYPDYNGSSSNQYNSIQGSGNATGFNAIMTNWSGGTYSPSRNSVLHFGGGHFAYRGNEVLEFSLDTLSWSRLTNATPFPTSNVAEQSDGTPTGRHTYNGVTWDSTRNVMMVNDGATADTGASKGDLWKFDPASGQWTRLADSPTAHPNINFIYVPSVDKAYRFQDTSPQGVWEYNPVGDSWSQVNQTGAGNKQGTVTYNPVDDEIWHFDSQGVLRIYDVHNHSWTIQPTTGSAPPAASFPGFSWNSETESAAWWHGGAQVYSLSRSFVWSVTTLTGSPPPATLPGSAGAPYGKFQYVAALNAYYAVVDTDDNVRIGFVD